MSEQIRAFTVDQFELLSRLCGTPSPVGFERTIIDGVILPEMRAFMPERWEIKRFTGTPGVVIDTAPDATGFPTIMPIAHADTIRLQVRSIGDDGKLWVNTDSFLPGAILGHTFNLVVEDPNEPGSYRTLPNLTAQAFGAIHFASEEVRSGRKGVEPKQVYLETGLFGPDAKQRLEELGVREGQPAVFSRCLQRGPTSGTFMGPYLDNSLGCFMLIETARRLAELQQARELRGVRVLLAVSTHEEVGLYGGPIAVNEHRPDIVFGLDVTHDFKAAPGIADRRMPPIELGAGPVITSGTVHSQHLFNLVRQVATDCALPLQRDVVGKREGNDSMAAALAACDAASGSISLPIRNMHTAAELGCDHDVLVACKLLPEFIKTFGENWGVEHLRQSHVKIGSDRCRL